MHCPARKFHFLENRKMSKPIKIFGSPISQNVRKPLAVAAHLGIAIESIPVGPHDPAVKAVNPCGRIPAMDDDGFTLGESNAIMVYLTSKKPSDIYPEDAVARAEVNSWLSWDVAHWTPAYQPIQFERLIKPMLGRGETDEAVVETATQAFHREAAHLDAALDGKTWLVGDSPTLADLAVGAGLTHADAAQFPWGDYANIRAWYERLGALDCWKKTTPQLG
jgi:glutathione S-transferase